MYALQCSVAQFLRVTLKTEQDWHRKAAELNMKKGICADLAISLCY